jgi:thymidylate synthase (FAD)
LEHESITLDITTDRGVLAELTRHRIGVGYSVESTRYVNYSKGVEFIIPVEYDKDAKVFPDGKALDIRYKIFQEACETAAYAYNQLIKNGAKPQEARAVLPQALKVNMKVTMNIRAWRHFFELRCAPSAHPNMREIAIAILLEFHKKMLPLFEDIKYDEDFYINHKVRIDSIFHVPTKATMQTSDDVILNLPKDSYEEYMKATEKEKVDKMTAAMDLNKDVKGEPEFEQMCIEDLLAMLFDNKIPDKKQLKGQLFEDMEYMESLRDLTEILFDWDRNGGSIL